MKKQQGMTAIGWLIVLGLIAFFALTGIRILPIYLESYQVNGSLQSLQQEPFITQKNKGEIIKMLERRFDINEVTNVDLKRDLTVEKKGGILKLAIKYEIRKHLLGNIDVVASFNPHLEIVEH